MVRIRLFARLKDRAGRSEIDLELRGPVPLKGLLGRLRDEIPQVVEWVEEKKVLVAVNQEMATAETVIHDGDEIGLMPPFSGGGSGRSGERYKMAAANGGRLQNSSADPWARIQREDFSLDEELRRIKAVSKGIGGVAVFIGTARDFSNGRPVSRLDYEHYTGLAEKTLADIRRRALAQFQVIEVCIIHRTGEVPIGGNIVLIMVAAGHRPEAFRACRWCIDELKSVAPIWKKETTPDGAVWVEERP